MSSERIKIPRVADRVIAAAFRELGAKFGVEQAAVSALGSGALGAVNLGNPDGDWAALLGHNATLIGTMSFSVGGLHVVYYRGGHYAPEAKSPIYDEILVSQNANQSASTQDRLAVIAFLSKKLKAFEPGRTVSGLSEEQSQLLAIHQGTLERLEALNEDLIRKNSEFRQALEEQFSQKIEASERAFQGRRDELEEALRVKADEVARREEGLKETLQRIDDRNNTHVRREIRDRMLDDVKARIDKFGVSPATTSKRRPVFIGMAILIISFASLLIWTGYEINVVNLQNISRLELADDLPTTGANSSPVGRNASGKTVAAAAIADVDKSVLYLMWGRLTLLSLGLIASIIYYIKWQNSWAERHSSAEFQLQQFYIDVNRANWVIESCLEWRKETSSAIPKELLQSITSGLFSDAASEMDKVIHPADELASALMGSASKVRLNLAGNEVEFDKPGKSVSRSIASKSG